MICFLNFTIAQNNGKMANDKYKGCEKPAVLRTFEYEKNQYEKDFTKIYGLFSPEHNSRLKHEF